jgi:hypothetical protein
MALKKLQYEMPVDVDAQISGDVRGRRLIAAGLTPGRCERTVDHKRGIVIFTQTIEVPDDGGPSGQSGEGN